MAGGGVGGLAAGDGVFVAGPEALAGVTAGAAAPAGVVLEVGVAAPAGVTLVPVAGGLFAVEVSCLLS